MEQLRGKVAVVTGAASGIGLALGRAFATEEMRLVLADVEGPALEEASRELKDQGAEVHQVLCDVSRPDEVERLRDETVEAFGTAHVVCNNAGVGTGGASWEIPAERWHWVFGVNFFGVVYGITSFVPLLVAQGEGHVVNTASAAGMLAVPYMGPYTASKHAVVALTEALHMELAASDSAVSCSVLCPMWVRTKIHHSERNAPLGMFSDEAPEVADPVTSLVAGLVEGGIEPSAVAEQVVSAVREDRFYVFPHEEVVAGVQARARRLAAGEPPRIDLGGS